MHKVAEETGIDRVSISDWLKLKEELLIKDSEKDSFRIQGA